jgi:hypothetical protein
VRNIFVSGTERVTGHLRRLHNEKPYDLYSPPTIIPVIKSRIRWARQVARMGKRRDADSIWWRNLMERDHLEEPDIYGRIILNNLQ